jgi:4-hydroxybenzoate polyprenyltransferase
MTAPTPLLLRGWQRLRIILEMIKFEHTLFALPFALIAALLAAGGLPPARTTVWILAAMAGARSSAMAFNRLVDLDYDRRNPRTAGRALPAGHLTPGQVWAFTAASTLLFLVAAWRLNPLALALAPVALGVIWGYSFTKRFTSLCHLFLGLAIGIAPSAAWIAVRGSLDWPAVLLTAAVLLWVGGFDILYACQDIEHDRREGLLSLPARLGIPRALLVARLSHAGLPIALLAAALLADLRGIYLAGVALTAALLLIEHLLVSADDLSRLNRAFFQVNVAIALVMMAAVVLDLTLGRSG